MTRIATLAWLTLAATACRLEPAPHAILRIEDPDGYAASATALRAGLRVDSTSKVRLDEPLHFPLSITVTHDVDAGPLGLWVEAVDGDGTATARAYAELYYHRDKTDTFNVALAPVCEAIGANSVGRACLTDQPQTPAACRQRTSGLVVCTTSSCGDGTADADFGEMCDWGAGNSDSVPNACRTDCTLPVCGDGIVDIGEICEPAVLGDACTSSCTIEPRIVGGIGHTCGLASDGTAVCWGDNDAGQSAPPPTARFFDLALGGSHSCGLTLEGSVLCWGDESYVQVGYDPRAFLDIATSGSHTCLVLADGSMRCWGNDFYGQSTPPLGIRFSAVTTAASATCGLQHDGALLCWGQIASGSVYAEGPFVDLGGGEGFVCAIDGSGTVACFGAPYYDDMTAPAGTFTQLATGGFHACALDADGAAHCWGCGDPGDANGTFPHEGQASVPPGMRLSTLGAGDFHTCAITDALTVECWGRNDLGQSSPPPRVEFVELALGTTHSCGRLIDQRVTCWGGINQEISSAPFGSYVALSAARHTTCAILQSGELACWGDTVSGRSTPPAGTFARVEVDDLHSCAIRSTDDTVACWGCATEACSPPAGTFTELALAEFSSCGVRTDGTVACWGDVTAPPSELLSGLRAGAAHYCGLRADGSLACWGDSVHGQTNAPQGAFSSLALGGNHGCAIRAADGTVACWGAPLTEEPEPGRFVALAAGEAFACGLREDGTVACWGAIGSTPSATDHTDLVAGPEHACAITAGGAVRCWGSALHGQTRPPLTFP